MRQNAFGGRAPPGPSGGASVLPRPTSRNWGCLLLRGEGKEGGKGSKGDGKGEGSKERGGKGGKEKDDLHPTLVLGPGPSKILDPPLGDPWT